MHQCQASQQGIINTRSSRCKTIVKGKLSQKNLQLLDYGNTITVRLYLNKYGH